MNRQIRAEDVEELQLRAQIMELRRNIPELERQQNAPVPRGFEEITAGFYAVEFEQLQIQRTELNNAERRCRDTYPHLWEQIQGGNHEIQGNLNERARRLQHIGVFPPDIRIVPPNPPALEPQNVGENRRGRWEEIQMQYQENGPLERAQIPGIPQLHLHRPPPAIGQFPVAEAQENPDIPHFGAHQDFLEQILARQRQVEAAAHRESQDPGNLIQDIRVENRQDQDEPRQEDQEGPENGNPEEPRQEEDSENQGEPENQPQILLDGRRPAVAAPDVPVVEEPATEEQREVVGPEGPHAAQPGVSLVKMNQQNVDVDVPELRLRARIMDLRRERQRAELNNLERFHRAYYPNRLDQIILAEEVQVLHDNVMEIEMFLDENRRVRRMQRLGELPREIRWNPLNRRRRFRERVRQREEDVLVRVRFFPEFLENRDRADAAPEAHEAPVVEVPGPVDPFVAELRANPNIAPGELEDLEFLAQVPAARIRVQRHVAAINARVARMNAARADLVPAIPVEHRQNQDEPRQEAPEGPENRNPEQPRQEEGPENQEEPYNQPDIQEVLFNPIVIARNLAAVEPQNARVNRRRRREEMEMQHQEMGPPNHDQLHEPPPAIRQFPVAEAQGNADDAPRLVQEFVERILEMDRLERLAQGQAAEMNAVPENWIQVFPVEHGQNQDEPRQENLEGPENQNPEEPPQEEVPENQGEPENQPQILLDGPRPAVVAPDAPVVEGPAPEEQREVVEPEGTHAAQPREPREDEGPENQGGPENQPQILLGGPRPAVSAPEALVVEGIAPEDQKEVGPEGPHAAQPGEQLEGLVEDDGVPHRQNQDEPRQEDQEGPENRNPGEPRQDEGPENPGEPDNQPQN
ncbi:hypothetical protein B9Z55_007200 [Caenorhabditis nigoni]|uniref:Uncharacterized protein n=1 Tax=Caenorhabditis nigoni TaxID=1611254 RepID=A0A2G5V8I7_9PELO|nr:hypothetical protein B9Z55_007200 [Caenorhabditis nigoni]